MARIFAVHEPFLQSKAQLIAMPVSKDGHVSHPVVARAKSMFATSYDDYYKKAVAGELSLGDVLLHKIPKQHTGLGVPSGGADYVANLIAHTSPEQPISVRMFTNCLKHLKPKLYELMRYQGLRRVALLGSAFLVKEMTDDGAVAWLTTERIVQVCHDVLSDVPKLSVDVHFGRDVNLADLQKVLEN